MRIMSETEPSFVKKRHIEDVLATVEQLYEPILCRVLLRSCLMAAIDEI